MKKCQFSQSVEPHENGLLPSCSNSCSPNLMFHNDETCTANKIPLPSLQPFPKLPSIGTIFGSFLNNSDKRNETHNSNDKAACNSKVFCSSYPSADQMRIRDSPISKELNWMHDRMQTYRTTTADSYHTSERQERNREADNSRPSIGNETVQLIDNLNRSNMSCSRLLKAVSTERQGHGTFTQFRVCSHLCSGSMETGALSKNKSVEYRDIITYNEKFFQDRCIMKKTRLRSTNHRYRIKIQLSK
jgi:hypothetical protein